MLKNRDMTSIATGGQFLGAKENAQTVRTPAWRVPAGRVPPPASLISRRSTNVSRWHGKQEPTSGAWRSCRACQVANPNQVVHRQGEGEHPPHTPHAAMAGLAKQAEGLGPAEDLCNPFALLLTDAIAGTG